MAKKKLSRKKLSSKRPNAQSRRGFPWRWAAVAALVIALGLVGYFMFGDKPAQETVQSNSTGSKETKQVTIDTDKGQIVIEIYPDLMPITTANFEKLVEKGFYDGLTFHRVEDWVVQGGDPNGNGTGGPGWKIKLETHPDLKNVRGAVAMARGRDRDSAGSQFYILKKDASWLDGDYAVFGKVVKGMEVVDKLAKGDRMRKVSLDGGQ